MHGSRVHVGTRPGSRVWSLAGRVLGASLAVLLSASCSVTIETAAPAGGGTNSASPSAPATPTGASTLISSSSAAGDASAEPSASRPPASPGPGELPGPPPPVEQVTPGLTGHLQLGPEVEPEGSFIWPEGGTISIDRPGDLLDGVVLTVPAGAYDSDLPFTVRAQPITGQGFGPLIHPVSPLITVDNGGRYADQLMTLRIPAAIPDGAITAAFFYDDADGTLEGVPLVARNSTGVTVATRHFSSIFVTIVLEGLPDIIDSGFRPGVDDWQFVNDGSYIAAGGHCSGQSVSAIWYYLERSRSGGASRLYGLYDDDGGTPTPGFDQDDADGYRLASMVQTDSDFDSWGAQLFEYSEQSPDSMHRDALRYSMAVTGEPQEILLYDANGRHGHAVVAYRITRDWILVADPNYPGMHRGIRWDEPKQDLLAYSSGPNATDIAQHGTIAFQQILYGAKSALVDWSTIGRRWTEFNSGTIGNDRFPPYTLVAAPVGTAEHGTWAELVNGYQTTSATVSVRLGDLTIAAPHLTVYRGTTRLAETSQLVPLDVALENGDNELGFLVTGAQGGMPGTYVDFQRLTVVRTPAEAVWQLVDGPFDIGATEPESESFAWTLSGEAGALQSTLTVLGRDGDPDIPYRVQFGWTVPATLVPDGDLVIDPLIRAPDGMPENATSWGSAALEAGLDVTSDQPPYFYGGHAVAVLGADGAIQTPPMWPGVPRYNAALGTRMYLQVRLTHGGANASYAYAYDWVGPR